MTMEDQQTLIQHNEENNNNNNNDDDDNDNDNVPSVLCSCGREALGWNRFVPHNNSIVPGNAFDLILVQRRRRRQRAVVTAAGSKRSVPREQGEDRWPADGRTATNNANANVNLDADADADSDSSGGESGVNNWAGSEVLVEFGGTTTLVPSHLGGWCVNGAGAGDGAGTLDDSSQQPYGPRIVLEIECARRSGNDDDDDGGSGSTQPHNATNLSSSSTILHFPICQRTIQMPHSCAAANGLGMVAAERMKDRPSSIIQTTAVASASPQHSPEALEWLASHLVAGRNEARYLLLDSQTGAVLGIAPVSIFVWSAQDRVVVFDIDGTITKSNIRGVFDTVLTESYQHCHDGVCRFLSSLPTTCACRVAYLTSRPLSLSHPTRKFLSQLMQDEAHCLPHGPLLGFPGSLAEVLYMELVTKSVHQFKHQAIESHIMRPFRQVGASDKHVLLAGFGNTLMDMQAYHMAGLDLSQIYLIDKTSKIYCLDYHSTIAAHAQPTNQHLSEQLTNQQDKGTTDDRPRRGWLHHDFLRRSRGSLFQGYHDDQLLDHFVRTSRRNVLAESSSSPSPSVI